MSTCLGNEDLPSLHVRVLGLDAVDWCGKGHLVRSCVVARLWYRSSDVISSVWVPCARFCPEAMTTICCALGFPSYRGDIALRESGDGDTAQVR